MGMESSGPVRETIIALARVRRPCAQDWKAARSLPGGPSFWQVIGATELCLDSGPLHYYVRAADGAFMTVQGETGAELGRTISIESLGNRRFDARQLTWVEQEFDLLFRADVGGDTTDEAINGSILRNLEAEMHKTMRLMSSAMNAQGRQLLRSKKTGLGQKSHQKLFPWLPWPGSVVSFHGDGFAEVIEEHFDLKKPLAGQEKDDLNISLGQIIVARFHLPTLELSAGAARRFAWRGISLGDLTELARRPRTSVIPITTFELVSLRFEAGSIWPKAKVRRKILATTMAFLSLGFVGTQVSGRIDRARQDRKFTQKVEAAARGPAVEYCGQRFSLDKLRTLQEDALDYNAKGISAAEKSCRVAQEQVALNLALNINMPVDGKPGKRTQDAEKQFGVENKVPGTNKNEMFRGKVLLQFKPPSER
jgi:hypothetical protein